MGSNRKRLIGADLVNTQQVRHNLMFKGYPVSCFLLTGGSIRPPAYAIILKLVTHI
jgi:hypothetical protein